MTDLPPVCESAKIRVGGFCTCPPCFPKDRRGLKNTFWNHMNVNYKKGVVAVLDAANIFSFI